MRASINKHMEVHETGCGRHGARSSHALFSLDVCLPCLRVRPGRVFMRGRSLGGSSYFRGRFSFDGSAKQPDVISGETFEWPTGDEEIVREQIVAWKREAGPGALRSLSSELKRLRVRFCPGGWFRKSACCHGNVGCLCDAKFRCREAFENKIGRVNTKVQ